MSLLFFINYVNMLYRAFHNLLRDYKDL